LQQQIYQRLQQQIYQRLQQQIYQRLQQQIYHEGGILWLLLWAHSAVRFNSVTPSGHYVYRQWSLYVPHSGHYVYRQWSLCVPLVVTICTAQWSLCVPPVVTICTASGHYMYRQFNIYNSTFCPHSSIYVFCVDLRTNSHYFPIQH